MSYLDEIVAVRRVAVEHTKRARPLEGLRHAVARRTDQRDFEAALRAAMPPVVIAEFKRASPSAGAIRIDADPGSVARAYERGGAAALSVLTEPERFHGSFADLRAAKAATSLPVLCKDFVVDAYQIWEAAAEGADAVLLIAALLDDATLHSLQAVARALRLAAIVEVHDELEAQRAGASGASLIGINNRDLRSFAVDTRTALHLRSRLPREIVTIAESGYDHPAQIEALARAGIDAVLVGESLMRAPDSAAALRRLRRVPK